MANTIEWTKPGDYNLIELSLVFSDNRKLDIVNNAVQIDLYESLYTSSMTGNIIFKDSDSVLETYNIIGDEKIIFKMATSTKNGYYTIEKEFIVVKISDFISEGKEQFYTMHLTTPISIIDKNYKISKSYDGYAEDILDNILQNTMGIEEPIIADFTKYPRKIVVPRMNPLSLFKYLADTSVYELSDDDSDTGYIFYESSVGFNFRYLRGLYDDGDPFTLYEKGKNIREETDGMDIIINAYIPSMFNNIDNQMLGVFGNNIISHDIIKKTLTSHEYGYSGSLAPNPEKYSTNNRFSFMSENYDGVTSNKWALTAEGNRQIFDNYNIILSVYGNSNITVGQTLNYEQSTNVFGVDNHKHKIFPRKHLITNVRHTFIGGVYSQTLECSSDRWYE